MTTLDRGPGPDSTAGPVTAFVDVNVVPMDADRVVAGQTVLVQDGTIVEIGPTEVVSVPADARVIDGTGRWLMPGLTDMHTHLGTNWAEFTDRRPPEAGLQQMAEGQMLLYLANGVTTIFNMGSFAEPVLRWRREVIDGRYPGPTIYAARWLRGPQDTPDGGPAFDAPTTASAARQFVRETIDSGYHLLKLYNWPARDVVLAAMQEAEADGLGIVGHFPQTMSTCETLASGMDLVAHAEAYLWTLFGYRVNDGLVSTAVAITRSAGASVTTTLGCDEVGGCRVGRQRGGDQRVLGAARSALHASHRGGAASGGIRGAPVGTRLAPGPAAMTPDISSCCATPGPSTTLACGC